MRHRSYSDGFIFPSAEGKNLGEEAAVLRGMRSEC